MRAERSRTLPADGWQVDPALPCRNPIKHWMDCLRSTPASPLTLIPARSTAFGMASVRPQTTLSGNSSTCWRGGMRSG